MSTMNKVQIIGFLGNDPEVKKSSSSDTVVTRMSVATTEKFTDKAGVKQERTEWFSVVAFNGIGEQAAKYLKKGSMVHIEGTLRTNKWEDKETKEQRSRVEVIATQPILFLDRKPQTLAPLPDSPADEAAA